MIEYEEFLGLAKLLKKLDIDAKVQMAEDRDHNVPFRLPNGGIGRIVYVPEKKEVRITTVGNTFRSYDDIGTARIALLDAFGKGNGKYAEFMEGVCRAFGCPELNMQ